VSEAAIMKDPKGVSRGAFRPFHRLITAQNGCVVTISDRELNTFRRLFGPPFTVAKGHRFSFSCTKGAARAWRLWGLFLCCVIYIQRGRDAKLRRGLI
jgi:hypothetical protein